jgi:hypothetical protein
MADYRNIKTPSYDQHSIYLSKTKLAKITCKVIMENQQTLRLWVFKSLYQKTSGMLYLHHAYIQRIQRKLNVHEQPVLSLMSR